jgi:hypothetical protein
MFNSVYCKPNETSGGLGGRPVGNPGAASEDNCPSISNASQTNTAIVDLDLVGPPGDSNGRFNGTADVTHPDGKFTGDDCDGDADNDGIPDPVEEGTGVMFFDSSGGTGATGSNYCNTNKDANGNPEASDTDEVVSETAVNVRDSDSDGSIDGVECQLKKNPGDPLSKPGTTMTPEEATFMRLSGLTQPSAACLCATNALDDGSPLNGITESRGNGALSGSTNDNDRDGCQDEVEQVDTDGSRVADNGDRLAIARAVLGVSTFAPAGSAQADLNERRTADVDYNGVLGDPDRLAAARIVLTASLPTVPDYNLSCSAATIGYGAN